MCDIYIFLTYCTATRNVKQMSLFTSWLQDLKIYTHTNYNTHVQDKTHHACGEKKKKTLCEVYLWILANKCGRYLVYIWPWQQQNELEHVARVEQRRPLGCSLHEHLVLHGMSQPEGSSWVCKPKAQDVLKLHFCCACRSLAEVYIIKDFIIACPSLWLSLWLYLSNSFMLTRMFEKSGSYLSLAFA